MISDDDKLLGKLGEVLSGLRSRVESLEQREAPKRHPGGFDPPVMVDRVRPILMDGRTVPEGLVELLTKFSLPDEDLRRLARACMSHAPIAKIIQGPPDWLIALLQASGLALEDWFEGGLKGACKRPGGGMWTAKALVRWAGGINKLPVERLKAAGYSCKNCKEVFGEKEAWRELSVFPAKDLRAAGMSCGDALKAGLEPSYVRSAGFTAEEMKKSVIDFNKVYKDYCDDSDSDYSDWEHDTVTEEYKCYGRTHTQHRHRLVKKIPLNPSWETVASAGYTGGELRKAGLPVKVAHNTFGWSGKQLFEAGYSLKQALDAGLPPAKAAACYPLSHLRGKVDTAVVLKVLDPCGEDLLMASYTAKELRAAKAHLDILTSAYDWKVIRAAGWTATDFMIDHLDDYESLRAEDTLVPILSELRQRGGFEAREIQTRFATPLELFRAGYSLTEIIDAREDVYPVISELVALGFTERQARRAGAARHGIPEIEFFPRETGFTLGKLLSRSATKFNLAPPVGGVAVFRLKNGAVLGSAPGGDTETGFYFALRTSDGNPVDVFCYTDRMSGLGDFFKISQDGRSLRAQLGGYSFHGDIQLRETYDLEEIVN